MILVVASASLLGAVAVAVLRELALHDRAEREADRRRDHAAALAALLAEHHIYVPERDTEDHA